MITLYRTLEDPGGEEVQESLRELGLAHEVVVLADPGPSPRGP